MAEEKTKEVKAEKKFCTKCGKEIKEGVEHECVQSSPATNSVTSDAVVNGIKDFFRLIGDSFKKPATTIKELVEKANWKHALITLAIIAISYGLYMSGAFTSLVGLLGDFAGGDINDLVDIPYFKIFIYMTLINFIVAFVPITVAFVAGKMSHNKDFDYKKAICLYTYSMVPTIVTNILMALLYAVDILTWLGALIGVVVSVICFFHFIFGFVDTVKVSEDKKSYAISGVVIVWTILSLVLSILLTGSLVKDVAGDFEIKDSNDYSDLFNW